MGCCAERGTRNEQMGGPINHKWADDQCRKYGADRRSDKRADVKKEE